MSDRRDSLPFSLIQEERSEIHDDQTMEIDSGSDYGEYPLIELNSGEELDQIKNFKIYYPDQNMEDQVHQHNKMADKKISNIVKNYQKKNQQNNMIVSQNIISKQSSNNLLRQTTNQTYKRISSSTMNMQPARFSQDTK